MQLELELGKVRTRQRITLERMEKRVEIDDDGCWIWHGVTNEKGYGGVWGIAPDGSYGRHRAHRISWQLVYGEIPNDKPHILHSCHKPSCVNPMHLRPGTNDDNVRDRIERRQNQIIH